MNHKKILNIKLVVSAVAFVVGYFFTYKPEIIPFCNSAFHSRCVYGIGEPLLFGMPPLALIFLILRFLPQQVFKAWLYFAAWYVPLAAAWIIITPTQGGHFLSPDKEGLTFLLGGVYLGISLLIILLRAVSLKFSNKPQ